MAVSKRTPAVILGIVASALTVTGVVLAVTDPNPSGMVKDTLALHGYPPKTAQIAVTISTGQSYTVQADLNVNFRTNRVEAMIQVPLVFSGVSIDARFIDHHLYATSSNLSSVIGSKWLAAKMNLPSLFGISLELTKPDISLITGFSHKSVTKTANTTVYDFSRDNVAVSSPGATSGAQSHVGTVNWSITTGSEGEVVQSTLTTTTKTAETTISATVLSYNKPAKIAVPPSSEVTSEGSKYLSHLLSKLPINSLVMPENLNSLGSTQLS